MLRHSSAGKAIEALAVAAPYELGRTVQVPDFFLYPIYLRGEAYLAAQQGTAAAAEFQKILDHPALVGNELIGALSHLELGRAYALSGDSAKAKGAYQGSSHSGKTLHRTKPPSVRFPNGCNRCYRACLPLPLFQGGPHSRRADRDRARPRR